MRLTCLSSQRMTRPSAAQSFLRRPDLGIVESTDGRWETASARPRVGEEHTGSVTAAQNKRIATVSSRSSRLVRCCSCFAREWLRSCPLSRAFASRGCLWALAKSACLAKNSSCLSSALDKSKAKISLEWAYLLWDMTHFYKAIAALRKVRHQWRCYHEVYLSNKS